MSDGSSGQLSESSVAIIILNWNGWEDTVECLRSLSFLEYHDFKVFLVDNNSQNDSVVQIQRAFPETDIICSETNLGFSGGNNLGIRKAMSEGYKYFWFLNNDTTVNSTALMGLVDKFKRNPELGLLGSVIVEYYNPTKIQAWGGGRVSKFISTTYLFSEPVRDDEVDYLHGASLLTRKEVLEEVGLFDESFFFFMEDVNLSLRIKKLYKIGVAKDSIVYHKGGSSLKSKDKHRNIIADYYYVASVGRFMRLENKSLIFVGTRLVLILLKRVLRQEFNRIGGIFQTFIKGYMTDPYRRG